jgi:uncharacterized repeat protein (TIGR03803 family)
MDATSSRFFPQPARDAHRQLRLCCNEDPRKLAELFKKNWVNSMACSHRTVVAMFLLAGLLAPTLAAASKVSVFYKATNWSPDSGVVFVAGQSKLYGTGSVSGFAGDVFSVDLKSGRYRALHTFDKTAAFHPAGLVTGANGTLYGVTEGGPKGTFGGVFKTDATTGRTSILFYIPLGPGGEIIGGGGLAVDPGDVIYGRTIYGGPDDAGTVFKFDPATSTYTTLHNFLKTDGCIHPAALIFNPSFTTLYATASSSDGTGCIVSIDAQSGTEATVLKSGTQGVTALPIGLLFGSASLLLVVADEYGSGNGQIFNVDLASGMATVIHNFQGGADGAQPADSLAFGPDGSLYGATTLQGSGHNEGTIYKLNVTTGVNTTLATFNGHKNTFGPMGSILVNVKGDVYGAGVTALYRVKHQP